MARSFTRSELGIYATVSEQLRKAREQKLLTLETCALETSIQKKYLTAIEESHFDALPGELYTRSWIKKYAKYLGLNAADLMISYEKELEIRQRMATESHTRTSATKARVWSFLTLRRLSIIILVAAVLTYIGILAYATISPPQIVLGPIDTQTQQDSITIRGQAESGTTLKLNQMSIALDANNAFQQEIALHEGLNTVTIEARKKHSMIYLKTITIVRTLPPTIQTATTTGPNY